MVKWEEVRSVHAMNRFHVFLMYLTAVVVLLKDFLTGVLSAMIVYALLYRFFDQPEAPKEDSAVESKTPTPREALTKDGAA